MRFLESLLLYDEKPLGQLHEFIIRVLGKIGKKEFKLIIEAAMIRNGILITQVFSIQ